MKKIIFLFLIFTFLPFFIKSGISQPPPPPPQQIPIDGGLFILFILGLIFAVKTFYSNYDKNFNLKSKDKTT